MKNHRKFFPEPSQNIYQIHAKSRKIEQKTKQIDKISHDDLRCAKNAKKMRKNAKKWPKTSPKDVQQGGPRPWDFSKLRPRGVQVASKRSKRRPRGAQDAPRASQERSKSAPKPPKSARKAAKSDPRVTEICPRDAQCASRGTFFVLFFVFFCFVAFFWGGGVCCISLRLLYFFASLRVNVTRHRSPKSCCQNRTLGPTIPNVAT